MKKDNFKTPVLFLIEKPESDLPNEVFAFFTNDMYSNQDEDAGKIFTCYAHIGQHSACHVEYADSCKKATPTQYETLKNELEDLGYNLAILN